LADLTITAANVKLVSGPTEDMIAGATLTAAQAVVADAATGKAILADNDHATATVRGVRGLALHAALADQPVRIAKNGAKVNLGAILTAGTDYYLSGTAGGICPRADVTTGDDPVRIGWAETTSILVLDIADMGVTL
jgi:hypothetical protein